MTSGGMQVVLSTRLKESGAEGDRTLDLGIANAALSQLSYRPGMLASSVANAPAKRGILMNHPPLCNSRTLCLRLQPQTAGVGLPLGLDSQFLSDRRPGCCRFG